MKMAILISFLMLLIVSTVLFIQNLLSIVMGLWVTYGTLLSIGVYFFSYNKNSSK